MIDARRFWKERMREHTKELSRYTRYIFNGHIAVVMFFLLSAGAYFYQQWLQTVPEDFPAGLIVALVFASITTYSPIRTMIKEPDLVFLLPAEFELKDYFRFSLYYSYVVQLYVIFLAGAALGPLYFTVYPELGTDHYLAIILLMLVVKAGVMQSNWWMLQERQPSVRIGYQAAVWTVSAVVFYSAAVDALLFVIPGLVLLAGLIVYAFRMSKQKAGLAWDLLLEKDQGRMRVFYRLANMFTDVPHLKSRVKRRRLIVKLLTARIPFSGNTTYTYLYRITFARSGDYSGMYIRLVAIGALAVWFIPNMWVSVIFGLLFLYLSGFQMMTLWQHHRTIAWLDIYPVSFEQRKEELIRFLRQLLFFQTLIFVVVFAVQMMWAGTLLMAFGGLLFSRLFTETFVRKRLN
ncbi:MULTISPECIES: ABC transporter permease [Salimicrobium]|uniref:ABC transporter permease n=1 Tax=Salimicrobium humidisoli TaxID=2029857 RepID=A0ABX4HNE8_9BACI|nr:MULTISPECIES: ABC transporter permease [Salimicrobium]PBB04610.1 ABC transporter permease [Salimicrobium humidisoli]